MTEYTPGDLAESRNSRCVLMASHPGLRFCKSRGTKRQYLPSGGKQPAEGLCLQQAKEISDFGEILLKNRKRYVIIPIKTYAPDFILAIPGLAGGIRRPGSVRLWFGSYYYYIKEACFRACLKLKTADFGWRYGDALPVPPDGA